MSPDVLGTINELLSEAVGLYQRRFMVRDTVDAVVEERILESEGSLKLPDFPGMAPVPIEADVTQRMIKDALSTTYTQQSGLVKALAAKPSRSMGKTEKAILSKISNKLPADLGAISKCLLYGDFFRFKKSEHAAILKLIKRGELKVVEISDPDGKYGKESIGSTGRRRFLVKA